MGVALLLEYSAVVMVVLWTWLRHGRRPGALTATGQAERDRIEQATDAAMDQVLAPVGDELPALTAQLAAWSDVVVAAGSAPSDPYKRVSG